MQIVVTGCAGFIGHAVTQALLQRGDQVIGIDNLNHYYDVRLKQARLATLTKHTQSKQFLFYRCDIKDMAAVAEIFQRHRPQRVVHLAAQAGVRYSLENPQAYIDSNIVGFTTVLESCRRFGIEHLVFASSSSVYGANEKYPYSVHDSVDHPVSLYAATKKSNELLAHTYSHLFDLPVTGLRYFTVYGPWGRPDMAPFKFANAIMKGEPIRIYNHGKHKRDFTFIDDITAGTVRVVDVIAKADSKWSGQCPDPASSYAPYKIYNLGYGNPVALMRFIEILEQSLGIEAKKEFLPKQQGDVEATWADISDLERDIGYRPMVSLEEGLPKFVQWLKAP